MFGASPGEETAAVGFEISRFHVCARAIMCVRVRNSRAKEPAVLLAALCFSQTQKQLK